LTCAPRCPTSRRRGACRCRHPAGTARSPGFPGRRRSSRAIRRTRQPRAW
jgi:hypothetical protein